MRRTIAAGVMALVVGSALVALAPVASAQTGYPPAPLACSGADTVVDAGTHDIGETFTVRLVPVCLWDPGSGVATSVNGQSVGTKIADAGGGVNVTITVLSANQLSVDDPVLVSSRCGENNAAGTGFSSAAGTDLTARAVFRVRCPGDADTARAARAPGAARAGVAFTGANIAKWGGLALGLLAIGSLLVIGARRRHASDS